MGNQLASLSHQPDNTIALPEGVTFEDRLGGGQFLRTLKCGSEDGALVVKVYSKRESRTCLLYTSPSPRDRQKSRMPSSA